MKRIKPVENSVDKVENSESSGQKPRQK